MNESNKTLVSNLPWWKKWNEKQVHNRGFLSMVSTCVALWETHGRRKGTLTVRCQQGPWKRLSPALVSANHFIVCPHLQHFLIHYNSVSAAPKARLVFMHKKVKFSQSCVQCKGNQQTGFVFMECSFALYRADQFG